VNPRVAILSTVGLLCLVATACRQTVPATDDTALQGAGATFPAPLYRKWIAKYHQAHPDVEISYDEVGSGEGVRRFLGESPKAVDFAGSDAALSPEQIRQAAQDRGVVIVPSTAGCVVLAYNIEGLNGPLKLPRDVYADIFLGKIKRWDDERIQKANPRLKLPETSIAVVVRHEASGTTFAFTNHLAAVSPTWREKYGRKAPPGASVAGAEDLGVLKVDWPGRVLPGNGNEGVAALIQRTPASIGYLEFGTARRAALPMAQLENRAGRFVAPSAASGLAALHDARLEKRPQLIGFFPDPDGPESYPIVTFTWLLLHKQADGDRNKRLAAFLRWCLTDGQEYNASLGFLRLPPDTAAAGARALAAVDLR
jgi:phosphate transport system substrate-binding protein